VDDAIDICRDAYIRVTMVTGALWRVMGGERACGPRAMLTPP
jgi:hypothetical protein